MAERKRVALVIGGGRGIGQSIARRLGAEGLAVGLLARSEAQLDETCHAIVAAGGVARAFPADVLDETGFERSIGRFLDWSGGCDTLVCAAGRLRAIGPLAVADESSWWLDLETSLRGAQRPARRLWPALRESGLGSIHLLVGPGHAGELAHASGYAAAQAALVRLAECLDREGRGDGIRVYAINPGIVPTDLLRPALDTAAGRRWLPRFTEALAEGKEVGPEFAAEMIAWLATERPEGLSGRVVAALTPPAILETRLPRIVGEDLGRLRLR